MNCLWPPKWAVVYQWLLGGSRNICYIYTLPLTEHLVFVHLVSLVSVWTSGILVTSMSRINLLLILNIR